MSATRLITTKTAPGGQQIAVGTKQFSKRPTTVPLSLFMGEAAVTIYLTRYERTSLSFEGWSLLKIRILLGRRWEAASPKI